MTPLPTADWLASLDRMTAAVAAALADLDRYEAAHRHLIDHEQAPAVVLPGPAPRPVPDTMSGAEQLFATPDDGLREAEGEVERWLGRLTGWQADR